MLEVFWVSANFGSTTWDLVVVVTSSPEACLGLLCCCPYELGCQESDVATGRDWMGTWLTRILGCIVSCRPPQAGSVVQLQDNKRVMSEVW